jgi:hypothetical protein
VVDLTAVSTKAVLRVLEEVAVIAVAAASAGVLFATSPRSTPTSMSLGTTFHFDLSQACSGCCEIWPFRKERPHNGALFLFRVTGFVKQPAV